MCANFFTQEQAQDPNAAAQIKSATPQQATQAQPAQSQMTPPSAARPLPSAQFSGQQMQIYPMQPVASPVDNAAAKARRAARSNSPKQHPLPQELNGAGKDSNESYQNALTDKDLNISPHNLGFYPTSYWMSQSMRFGDLVTNFFHRKNSSNCRFPHKLYNALLLVGSDEAFWPLVGVKWVTSSVFKVDKLIFGRLLGIGSYDGGLFHRQGNFPSHGFKELTTEEAAKIQCDPALTADVDHERVRLLKHKSDMFVQHCSEDFINNCKWDSTNE